MRLDVALNRLCLTKSRSEAKTACEAGAVFVDGGEAKPSQTLRPDAIVELRYSHRTLEVRIVDLPPKSVSKQRARDFYDILRDEPTAKS